MTQWMLNLQWHNDSYNERISFTPESRACPSAAPFSSSVPDCTGPSQHQCAFARIPSVEWDWMGSVWHLPWAPGEDSHTSWLLEWYSVAWGHGYPFSSWWTFKLCPIWGWWTSMCKSLHGYVFISLGFLKSRVPRQCGKYMLNFIELLG